MKKSIMDLQGAQMLSKNQQKNVRGGDDPGRPRGCRQWRIRLFNYTIVEHNNDACQNSDGNWDWGGNGNLPT